MKSARTTRNKLNTNKCFQIGKVKAQARIEALRAGGIDVDVWLNSSNLMEEDDDELCNGRKTPASDKSEASSVAVRFVKLEFVSVGLLLV